MKAFVSKKWRVGRKIGRTIYAMIGDLPSDGDTLIGMMDSADLANAVIADHNARFYRK